MKILLVGEYSRLHNSLKEGLTALGHEVVLVGNNDGFKNYPVDVPIGSKIAKNKRMFTFAKGLNKLTGINLVAIENALRFRTMAAKAKGFDVVQLYNESPVKSYVNWEIWALKKLFRKNKNIFLLACGIDYISVRYAHEKKFRYSILTPLQQNKGLKKEYEFIVKVLTPARLKLHRFLFGQIKGVIACDLDYHIPYIGHKKYLGLIPNPVNIDKIPFIENPITDKVVIFHGINRGNYYKKGNDLFENALKTIQEKYADKVEIWVVENVPYDEYIKLYDRAHILLDQVYAYDQGYNALEAMAKGKVVFTGAEKEWLEHYGLEADTVAINALPDVHALVEKLRWLIENPQQIEAIGKKARAFIEKEHHYKQVAERYLDVWGC